MFITNIESLLAKRPQQVLTQAQIDPLLDYVVIGHYDKYGWLTPHKDIIELADHLDELSKQK